MITMGKYEMDRMVDSHRMPEWVRSERYEFCDGFYDSYTTGKGFGLIAKLASVLTALFI